MDEEKRLENQESFEMIQEDSGYGSISINNDVVANIVAMAAREVPGVVSIASGGLRGDLAGLFSGKKDSGTGVSIKEDENGEYVVGIKLILTFGVQLAKVAQDVQCAIRDQVENMTNKGVSKVNVIVDGVRQPESPKEHPTEED